MTPEKKAALTLDLTKALTELHNVETRLSVLANDLEVRYKVKNTFKSWLRMITKIKMEFNLFYDDMKDRKVIQSMIFNDEITLQLEAINSYLLALPKEKRDQFEDLLENEVKNYKKVEDVHS